MAHSALHLSIGLAVGTAVALPSVIRAWRRAGKMAPALARLLAVSWGLAVLSIVPSLFRNVGLPETFCSGWWMNLFLFHPLLDQLKRGGMLVGELAAAACLTFQYVLLLLALRRARAGIGRGAP